jgi:DNA-binding IclR family transcriptional regulator
MSQAARRTLDLLEQIARSEDPLSSTELAARAHLDKSTTSRLLGVLDQRALVSRQPSTKKYIVGPRLLALSALAISRFELSTLVSPTLRNLRDETDETVSLHLRVADERICIAGHESSQPIRRALPLGQARPLWLGPSSKVILAFSPDQHALLNAAQRSGADIAVIVAQLASIRSEGHMIAVGDRTPGIGAVSVPIVRTRLAIGSLTVAGPSERFVRARMQGCVTQLRDAAAVLAEVLGAGAA